MEQLETFGPGMIAAGVCSGVVLLIVLTSVLTVFRKRTRARRSVAEAFAGRKPLSFEEFHAKYFAEKEIPMFVSTGVRKVLESELETDMSRLAGTDDFAGNLSFLRSSLEHPETMFTMEKVFEIRIAESDTQRMGTTVADIVDLVWITLQKQAAESHAAIHRSNDV